MIQPSNRLGEVKEYYFSKKLREIAQMRAAGKNVLNLGIGSPDLAPDEGVINEIVEQSQKKNLHGYQSYVGIPELREAFAGWYERHFQVNLNPSNEILPLIGSKEGIMHISMTYLNHGDEVLIPNPGYPAYRAVSNLAGANVVEYKLSEEEGWFPDLKAIEKRDLSKVKIMWVNYPHMPTGTNASEGFYTDLIEFARKHRILVVNDNPYSFILNEQPRSLLSVPGAKDVALELNSLSKSHNMAGWRVGMLSGKAEYVQTILRFKSNMDSGMFKPLQLAAVKALQYPDSWYSNLNEIYSKRRDKVYNLLDDLNCVYNKNSVGMFVWARIPKVYKSGFDLSDEVLYNSNVFITPGGIFGSQGEKYIRVSLCSDVTIFDEAIKRISTVNA